MTGQQLKNSILQMAVQGRLVPQDPNDEPASVLLERIRKEKEQLIKDGKIKKEKNPSYIFRGADNLPYEKVGKNEPVCIADEVPFEIPESWEWVRLGSIGDWGAGATPSRSIPEYYDGNIPWLKTGDLNDDYIVSIPESISNLALEKTSVRLNPSGSVLIAMYGATIGKVGILTFPATTNQACCACLPLKIFNEYLFYFLMSQKNTFVKQGEGGAQPNISKEKIVSTFMPLPPLEEQHRIVAKIKQLLPYIEKYNEAHTSITFLNTTFPDQLRKSILQEAVQGKLVPQDSNDEPASVLLERIHAEKERLIKEGKIKRDKHESVIFKRDNSHYEKLDGIERCIDDEIPSEIPESWEWVRFFSVVEIATNLVQPELYSDYMHIAPDNIEKGTGTLLKCYTVRQDKVVSSNHLFCKGQIIYSKIRPLLRKAIIAPFNGLCSADMYPLNTSINKEYLLRYLLSDTFNLQVASAMSSRVKMPKINQNELSQVLIPIPPMQEQERIVNRIGKMFDRITLI